MALALALLMGCPSPDPLKRPPPACDVRGPAGPLGVPVDRSEAVAGQSWRRLAWTPIALQGAGRVRFELSGPVALYDSTATPISTLQLPGTVYARATGGGEGEIVAQAEGCAQRWQIPVVAKVFPGLSAAPLPAAPHATHVDAFLAGGRLRVAVDPARIPQAAQRQGAVWVVADRDRGAWLDDPVLVDLAGGPTPFALHPGPLHANTAVVWENLPDPPTGQGRYDLVWDLDGDGRLSDGDVLDGLDGPGFVVYGDLSRPGPYTPSTVDVSPSTYRTQRITWPAQIRALEAPAPLVVISHGNGHEYTWYDHLAQHLASHGWVVMSHRNNTEPGVGAAALTTLDNTDVFARDHALFVPDLAGQVDLGRITWIGHSRGGEGVLLAYERLALGEANVQLLAPEDIALISSIAPTAYQGPRAHSPGRVPFHLLAGGADGDVTGGVADAVEGLSCPMCQWFRLRQGAEGMQAVTYLQGASHNDFCALGLDDGIGLGVPRFGKPAVHHHMQALYLALLQHVVAGDAVIGEFLRRHPDALSLPRPSGATVATQFRDDPDFTMVIDNFQREPDLALSSRGAPVRTTLVDLVEGPLDDGNTSFTWSPADPMNGMTESHDDPPELASRGLVLGWEGDASWEVELPDGPMDLTAWRSLSLRVAWVTRHPGSVDGLSFGVGLVGASGREVVLDTASWGLVPPPTPRTGLGSGVGWANEFTTLRVRLTDFEHDGLDLGAVRSVRLRFGPTWGTAAGRIGLDDLMLEAR